MKVKILSLVLGSLVMAGLVNMTFSVANIVAQGTTSQSLANPFFTGNLTTSSPGNLTTSTQGSVIPQVNDSRQTPFEGESIKIFAFNSFVKESEWEPIDNYTSNGYDIKSLMPFGNRFFIVLEKGTG